MRNCLIDTGPFVSYLHRKDPAHDRVASFIDNFKGRLSTTSAVVGEVMYFVSELPDGPIAFAEFLMSSDTQIAELSQPKHIFAAAGLMKKYVDTPMDFADATLILLAEEVGVTEILTLDRRGFSTYRTSKGKAFRLASG
jgi:predicted nucleic acid-binding protein